MPGILSRYNGTSTKGADAMRRVLLLTGLIAILVLPGCRRKPEPVDVERVTPPPAVVLPTPVSLELPVTNDVVGITVNSMPAHLVISYSGEGQMEFAVRDRPDERILVVSHPDAGELDPARYHEEARFRSAHFGGGHQTATGVVEEAPFGPAAWSASTFTIDGRDMDQVELVSPHPEGTGVLSLRSRYPKDRSEIAAKVAELVDLLPRVLPVEDYSTAYAQYRAEEKALEESGR
jgi:hypothetical protein